MMTLKPSKKMRTKDGWYGKIRRIDWDTKMALIEWDYCGDLPTDICTWVSFEDLYAARQEVA